VTYEGATVSRKKSLSNMRYDKIQEKQLVIEAMMGKEESLIKLIESIHTRVLCRIKEKLHSRYINDAEQDVWEHIYKNIQKFDLTQYDKKNEDGSDRVHIFYIWVYFFILKKIIGEHIARQIEDSKNDSIDCSNVYRNEGLYDSNNDERFSPEIMSEQKDIHLKVLRLVLIEGGPPHYIFAFCFNRLIKIDRGIEGIVTCFSQTPFYELSHQLERIFLGDVVLKENSKHYSEIKGIFNEFRCRLQKNVVELLNPNSPHEYSAEVLFSPAGETKFEDYFNSSSKNNISVWSNRVAKKIIPKLVELGIPSKRNKGGKK
jgi:hypothetical protein